MIACNTFDEWLREYQAEVLSIRIARTTFRCVRCGEKIYKGVSYANVIYTDGSGPRGGRTHEFCTADERVAALRQF